MAYGIYPPNAVSKEIRKTLYGQLNKGRFDSDELVENLHSSFDYGWWFSERALMLELSRMNGSKIKLASAGKPFFYITERGKMEMNVLGWGEGAVNVTHLPDDVRDEVRRLLYIHIRRGEFTPHELVVEIQNSPYGWWFSGRALMFELSRMNGIGVELARTGKPFYRITGRGETEMRVLDALRTA